MSTLKIKPLTPAKQLERSLAYRERPLAGRVGPLRADCCSFGRVSIYLPKPGEDAFKKGRALAHELKYQIRKTKDAARFGLFIKEAIKYILHPQAKGDFLTGLMAGTIRTARVEKCAVVIKNALRQVDDPGKAVCIRTFFLSLPGDGYDVSQAATFFTIFFEDTQIDPERMAKLIMAALDFPHISIGFKGRLISEMMHRDDRLGREFYRSAFATLTDPTGKYGFISFFNENKNRVTE